MTSTTERPISSLAGEAPTYRDELDEELLCFEVRQETTDVASFVLRSATEAWLRFSPGQYLTLTVNVAGERLSRCYSISSSPLWPDAVTVTVKRVPGGPVSNWLHDHLRPGRTVHASGPLGSFTTDRHPSDRYLFLSAGSGITPLMSMARTLHGCNSPADVAFVHSARTPDDIIFQSELEHLDATSPTFRVTVVCEDDGGFPWTGLTGRLDLDSLRAAVPDVLQREVFTCGPPGYREAVRHILAEAGVELSRSHEESYVIGEPAGSPHTPADDTSPVRGHAVELARTGRAFECPDGMSVLEAAERAGVRLPSSCAEGVCGTCKTQLVTGSVDMRHAGGIRPPEVAAGNILLCCSTPCQDIVLDA